MLLKNLIMKIYIISRDLGHYLTGEKLLLSQLSNLLFGILEY